MAGYSSRILVTLTVSSVFSFLSVLWFLKKRSLFTKGSEKYINKAIQVEDSSGRNRFSAVNSMKLKDKNSGEESVNSSEMQLKETPTSQSQNCNGIQQNGKAKGKKKGRSKLRENSSTCTKESVTNGKDKHNSVEDNVTELANNIEAVNLNGNASAKKEILLQNNKRRSEMEIRNGTNAVHSNSTDVNGDTEEVSTNTESDKTKSIDGNVGSDKVQCDTDVVQIPSDRNFTSDEKERIELPPEIITSTTELLTLPAECTDAQGDVLESPGAAYCDSVGSNDSGTCGSENQFSREAQQVSEVYEFEILQELCGLLIGRNGRHVNYIKEQTNANILIKRHPVSSHKKICSVTGTDNEVNAALKMIRKRFPAEVYPTVTLAQINILPLEFHLSETLKLSLPEGVSFEGMLCATVNAGHFFLQQPTHPTFHSLPILTAHMNDWYSHHPDAPKLSHLRKGYVCVGKILDGWYRAEIDEVFGDVDECRLKFLDYGGYAVLSRSNLRQIRFDVMCMPFQATECYLGSITFPEGETDWSYEATAAFEELAQGQIVQGYIVGYARNRVPYVYLYKITGATSVFINKELVSRGLARWIIPPH